MLVFNGNKAYEFDTVRHECELDDLEFFPEKVRFEEGGVVVPCRCQVCGREYEEVYTRIGIWDPEREKYIYFD